MPIMPSFLTMLLSNEQIELLKNNKNLITEELLDALRETKEGYAFNKDDDMQLAFEKEFTDQGTAGHSAKPGVRNGPLGSFG